MMQGINIKMCGLKTRLTKRCKQGLIGVMVVMALAACTEDHTATAPADHSSSGNENAEQEGVVHVPAFSLPESAFLSEETRKALKKSRDVYRKESLTAVQSCPNIKEAHKADIPAIRLCQAEAFYKTSKYQSLAGRYAVNISSEKMGGVYTEVITPSQGVAPGNQQRVLLNVHGGGFQGGARFGGRIESLPIAALGKIKVISIDYRMAPENVFPAASEDVAAVYREVLKQYKPENIGLYGCSAGGQLTAQSIAWFEQHDLPLPGAVGMFCAGAPTAIDEHTVKWLRSDSAYISGAMSGTDYESKLGSSHPYYEGVDRDNPLASPGGYDEVMAKFPPSLLISGTRDFLLSGVVYTHAQLVRLGVETELHIWEGMEHGFQGNPDLPESREAYDVIVRFFDKHLGR